MKDPSKYLVITSGDTVPFVRDLKNFGLRWNGDEWRGIIVGWNEMKHFISYCKETGIKLDFYKQDNFQNKQFIVNISMLSEKYS